MELRPAGLVEGGPELLQLFGVEKQTQELEEKLRQCDRRSGDSEKL